MRSVDYLQADPLFQRAKALGGRCRAQPIIGGLSPRVEMVGRRGVLKGHLYAILASAAAFGLVAWIIR